jgi:hypothetical protein
VFYKDRDSFETFYRDLLKEPFDELLISSVNIFSASPLRIVTPKFVENERGFTVYSGAIIFYILIKDVVYYNKKKSNFQGFTQPAPFLKQFVKKDSSKVDLNKVKKGVLVNSLEDCAQACLSESQYEVLSFKCLSFDFCKNPSDLGFICSLYNASVFTDPDVIVESAPSCDHYSSIHLYINTY